MIADEVEEMIKEFEYRLLYQGMKLDDYLRYSGITRERWRKIIAKRQKET